MNLILPPGQDPRAHLARLAQQSMQPRDARVLAFFAAFSERILADHTLRQWPELIALAYWFRPAAVAILIERQRALETRGVLRPRGIALHFAPANVDSIFVYSWFLSMLCGNRNIVRISSRDTQRRQILLDLLAELLAEPKHAAIAESNAVFHAEHADPLIAELSARCHLRVIWGGDAAVSAIRQIPLSPRANEVVFPNRQSWAILDAQAVLNASDAELGKLCAGFYNDAFWFAQQACSSPRVVLWIGQRQPVHEAQLRFWHGLDAHLQQRASSSEAAETMARINAAHLLAAQGEAITLSKRLDQWPLRIAVDTLSPAMREQHCGYGLFFELQRPLLAGTGELFAEVDQSISSFGLPHEALRDWLNELPDRAIDRIVPIGEALRFSDFWDGLDLLQSFSRLTTLA